MITKLKKLGNSQALLLQKALLEALSINEDSLLQLTIKGNSLVVTPTEVGIGEERINKSIEELRPEYGKILEDLAK